MISDLNIIGCEDVAVGFPSADDLPVVKLRLTTHTGHFR